MKKKIGVALLTILMLLQSIGSVFATETSEVTENTVNNSSTVQVLEKDTITGETTTSSINYDALEKAINFQSISNLGATLTQSNRDLLYNPSGMSVNAIIGNDNRTLIYDPAICYILSDGIRGTGFLISPNVVVTSSHLIYNYTSKTFHNSITVTPGKNGSINNAPYGNYTPTKVIIPEYSEAHLTKYDYAILILNGSPGTQTGWLNMNSSNDLLDGKTVNIRSYSSIGLSGNTSYDQWSSYDTVWGEKDLNDGIFLNNCDTTAGASGSPILFNNKVCGIHYGGTSDGNLGIKIDKRLYYILNNYALNGPGCLDRVDQNSIDGWAIDTNKFNVRNTLDVHAYIKDVNNNVVETKIIKADKFRSDVGNHGFSASMNWLSYKPGTYNVYTYAICYDNPLLTNSPKSFTVRPIDGTVDNCNASRINGWVYKPDAPNEPIDAHVYIYNKDGQVKLGMPLKANEYRIDLANAGIGNGYHAFSADYSKLVKIEKGDYIKVFAVDGSGDHPVIYHAFW